MEGVQVVMVRYGRIGSGSGSGVATRPNLLELPLFWRRTSWKRVALELPRAKTTARPIAGSERSSRESREVTMRS